MFGSQAGNIMFPPWECLAQGHLLRFFGAQASKLGVPLTSYLLLLTSITGMLPDKEGGDGRDMGEIWEG